MDQVIVVERVSMVNGLEPARKTSAHQGRDGMPFSRDYCKEGRQMGDSSQPLDPIRKTRARPQELKDKRRQ